MTTPERCGIHKPYKGFVLAAPNRRSFASQRLLQTEVVYKIDPHRFSQLAEHSCSLSCLMLFYLLMLKPKFILSVNSLLKHWIPPADRVAICSAFAELTKESGKKMVGTFVSTIFLLFHTNCAWLIFAFFFSLCPVFNFQLYADRIFEKKGQRKWENIFLKLFIAENAVFTVKRACTRLITIVHFSDPEK